MDEYRLKVVGVHYAANPDGVGAATDVEAMEERTVEMLRWLDAERPRVVLVAEPSNMYDPNAVMVRAAGRKVGYVVSDQATLALRLLKSGGKGMMCASIAEVEVKRRGNVGIVVRADREAVERTVLGVTQPDWDAWRCNLPALPPCERWLAMEEAEFVLAELLEHPDETVMEELTHYMTVWIDSCLHDLSRDTKQLRERYMEQLAALGDARVEPLIKRIDKQRVAVRGDHRRAYRMAWWDEMRHSEEMERYWMRWTTRAGREPWRDLYEVDRYLRQLPSRTYDYVGDLDTFCTRLYSLDIPRGVLWHVYSLFLLRERLCHELGIAIQPLAPDAYDIEDMEEATRQDDVTKRDSTEEELPAANDAVARRPISELILEACSGRMKSGSDWIALYYLLTEKGYVERTYAGFARYINAMSLPGLPRCNKDTLGKAHDIYTKKSFVYWSPADAPEVKAAIVDRRKAIARELSRLLRENT